MAAPRQTDAGILTDAIEPATPGGFVDMTGINTLIPVPQRVSAGVTQTIPEHTQVVTFGTVTVHGSLTILGALRVASLPAF